MGQEKAAGRFPGGPGSRASHGAASSTASPPEASIPNAAIFTNANFGRVLSKMSANLSRKTAEIAYGMWNPRFCAADAAHEADTFFAALEAEAKHWRALTASAIEARRAETVQHGSVHESATAESRDAQSEPRP